MIARSLGAVLERTAAAAPEARAVQAGGEALTYAELDARASEMAAGLARLGVRPGDRGAVALGSTAAAVAAIYGVWRAGAVLVPVNAGTPPEKLRFIVGHAEASVLLATPSIAAAAGTLDGVQVVVEGQDAGRGASVLAEVAAPGAMPAPDVLDVDLAAIIYTSGSTGRPKGVALTHGNLLFVTLSIVEYLELDASDRVLSVLPLSFGYGLSQLLTCVHARARLILEPGFGYPGRLVQLLRDEGVTGMPGVPTIFRVLTGLPGIAEREFPALRFLTNAGAGLPPAATTALATTFPNARLYLMYGQTECIRVCFLAPDLVATHTASVGRPIPGTEAWVETEDGRRAEAGEVGELVVRGAHVMPGYWREPDATREKLREGRWPWERVLHTGDLFRTDADGLLYFVSRTDDIIKSRGEKVPPREVEDVLLRAGGVRDAAVVGMPDELLGEAVHAHVTALPGQALDERALRAFCAQHLEDHMVPRRITIHDELPKSENGKIDRITLMGRTRPSFEMPR